MCTFANFVRVFLSTKLFWEFPDLQFNLIFLHRTKCSSTLFRSDVVNTTGAPFTNIPDIKVHGANMGLIWGRQDPGGPHVGPMNFTIWDRLTLILSWKIYYMPSSERDGVVEVWIFSSHLKFYGKFVLLSSKFLCSVRYQILYTTRWLCCRRLSMVRFVSISHHSNHRNIDIFHN